MLLLLVGSENTENNVELYDDTEHVRHNKYFLTVVKMPNIVVCMCNYSIRLTMCPTVPSSLLRKKCLSCEK